MKTLVSAILTVFAFSQPALADTIVCDFTEPFIQVSFDTKTGNLEVNDFGQISNFQNAELEITGVNNMKLNWGPASGYTHSVDMTVDYRGSNGMSDHLYPYSAAYDRGENMPLYGGCYSDNLKLILPDGGAF